MLDGFNLVSSEISSASELKVNYIIDQVKNINLIRRKLKFWLSNAEAI